VNSNADNNNTATISLFMMQILPFNETWLLRLMPARYTRFRRLNQTIRWIDQTLAHVW
jgi:hypothetical protein